MGVLKGTGKSDHVGNMQQEWNKMKHNWNTQSHIAVKCISGENLTGNRSGWSTGGFADGGSWLAISRGSSHIVTRPGKHTKNYWTWPIEIVDLIYPLKIVIFHSYVTVYQRVLVQSGVRKYGDGFDPWPHSSSVSSCIWILDGTSNFR